MANNVTTHHYDNGRTGWNKNETVLTPLSVNRWNFGYLFQQALDDIAFAQPLYLGCLRANGAAHSVVYVATEAGTVYAFDADHLNNRLPLWQISILGGANEVRSDWLGAITATPVIDPATNTLYVLGYFLDNNYTYTYLNYLSGGSPILPPIPTTRTGAYFFRLHALDLITGSIKATSAPIYSPFLQLLSGVQPATILLEAPGAGLPQDPKNAGTIYFDPGYQGSRPALLLVGGNVYAGFGSHGDVPPYHGWIIGFETQHLGVIGHFCSTPDASLTPGIGNYLDDLQIGGSFWMAGWGLAADSDGYIYGMTANGLFLDPPNVYPHNNYAESLLKLDQNLNLSGSFTPANYLKLSQLDTDFGSAGPIVLPNQAGGGKFVVGCGKDANVYLVNRTSLVPGTLHTNFTSADTHALTQGPDAHPIDGGGSGPGVWGGGAYYGGPLGDVIYYCGDHGPLQSFQVKAGKLTPLQQTNTTTTTELFLGEGGVIPVVTSNGVQPQTGVVWGVTRVDTDPSLPPRLRTDTLRLRAYTAENLAQPNLVDQPIGSWNGGGGAFLAPIAVNGKVYVASDHQLNVYGIVLNSTLIQSSFGTPANLGNFEALIAEENRLVHFWRDNSAPGFPWHRTVALSSQVTGPACLIQGSFGAPANPGNFEALVLEGNNVVHYYRDNSTSRFPWNRTVALSNAATGPATFIQGTFGAPLHPGNFEALVLEGNNLFHYYRDNTAPGFPWHKTAAVSAAATGPGCLIQSTFGAPGNPGNFEALVLEGNNLVHYWRDNSTLGFPWNKSVVVSSSAIGPASLIQSTFGAPGNPGNFEALVLESNPAHPDFPPYNLVHYWRDNSTPGFPWNKSVVVSSSAIGPATLVQSTFHAAGKPGNFEVLVAEEGNTVMHYWRDDSNPALPWNSDTVL